MVKAMHSERILMVKPNNPLRTSLLAEAESLHYRRRIMHTANLLRLFFALIYLLFAPFFLSLKVHFIWNMEFVGLNAILLFGCLYIVLLAVITLYSIRNVRGEWIFLVNALIDIFFFVLFVISLRLHENWQWFMPFVIVSVVLSLLTLNLLQCTIYALFFYLEVIVVYSLSLFENSQYPITTTFASRFLELWQHKEGMLFNIGISAGVVALFIFLVGFLSANARENGIMAKLNRSFYEQSRSLNESIIAEMPSGLIVLNVSNEIVTMNRMVRDRFRIKSDDDIPLSLYQLSPLLAKQFNRWLDLKHNDLQPLNLFGEKYTATFTPLPIEGYSPLILVSLENVESSYQRVRETRLASLGRLTAGIAHEIRNPLGSIQTANELITETRPNDQHIQALCKKIYSNSNRINSIISDILDMFNERPCVGQLIIVNDFIRKIMLSVRDEYALEYVPIHLGLDDTEDFAIFFDPSHLTQILHNLMLNAVKHSGRTDVEITIITQVSEGGRSLYLDIMDNGIGVPEDMRERVFEPFYSSRQGTGLGLYLVREMCLANQAHIVYVPTAKGACFRIIMERYLPEEKQAKEGKA